MKLLPYEKITVKTNLDKTAAIKSLAMVTQKKKIEIISFSKFKPNKDKIFYGRMINDSFSIERIIGYRNSFLPQINGRFQQVQNGTEIELSFKMHAVVTAFMVFWFGILTVTFIGMISIATREELLPIGIVSGMLIFGGIIVVFAFNHELKKAMEALGKVWNISLT